MNGTVVELAFETANLAVLGAGLWWLLFQPVRRALEDEGRARADRESTLAEREQEIAKQAADLASQRAEHAKTAEAARQAALAAAREEAAAIVDAARHDADRARVAWTEEQAQRQAEAAREASAMTARLAAEATTRLLATIDGPELEEALARAAVGLLPPSVERPVWVEAVQMDEGVRKVLEGALPHGFEVRIRPDLAAGLRIGTPAGLVDCSAAGMARAAAEVAGG